MMKKKKTIHIELQNATSSSWLIYWIWHCKRKESDITKKTQANSYCLEDDLRKTKTEIGNMHLLKSINALKWYRRKTLWIAMKRCQNWSIVHWNHKTTFSHWNHKTTRTSIELRQWYEWIFCIFTSDIYIYMRYRQKTNKI